MIAIALFVAPALFIGVEAYQQAGSDPKYPGNSPLESVDITLAVFEATNEERLAHGLSPLVHDPAIAAIARAHSENMVYTGMYDHVIHGKDPTDRALEAGYDCRGYYPDGSYSYGLSENIAAFPRVMQWSTSTFYGVHTTWKPDEYHDSHTLALALVEAWMNSSGHRANILDDRARKFGVGIAIALSEEHGWISEEVFATQNFSACDP